MCEKCRNKTTALRMELLKPGQCDQIYARAFRTYLLEANIGDVQMEQCIVAFLEKHPEIERWEIERSLCSADMTTAEFKDAMSVVLGL